MKKMPAKTPEEHCMNAAGCMAEVDQGNLGHNGPEMTAGRISAETVRGWFEKPPTILQARLGGIDFMNIAEIRPDDGEAAVPISKSTVVERHVAEDGRRVIEVGLCSGMRQRRWQKQIYRQWL